MRTYSIHEEFSWQHPRHLERLPFSADRCALREYKETLVSFQNCSDHTEASSVKGKIFSNKKCTQNKQTKMPHTYSFPVRFKITSTGAIASSRLSIRRAFQRAIVVSDASPVAMQIPGLSNSIIFESRATSCIILHNC